MGNRPNLNVMGKHSSTAMIKISGGIRGKKKSHAPKFRRSPFLETSPMAQEVLSSETEEQRKGKPGVQGGRERGGAAPQQGQDSATKGKRLERRG